MGDDQLRIYATLLVGSWRQARNPVERGRDVLPSVGELTKYRAAVTTRTPSIHSLCETVERLVRPNGHEYQMTDPRQAGPPGRAR